MDASRAKPLLTMRTPAWQAGCLWLMIAGLAAIGVSMVVGASIDPPDPRLVPPWVPWAGCGVMLGIATLLGWAVASQRERFEVDASGITWRKGMRPPARLDWDDVARIRLQDAWGRLVLEGRPGCPTIKVVNTYEGFDAFVAYLRAALDWEALIQGRPASGPSGPTGVGASARAEEVPEMPMVHTLRGKVIAPMIGVVLFVAVSWVVWFVPERRDPLAGFDPIAARGDARQEARARLLRYIGPFAAVMCAGAIFTGWYRLRIERDGLELDYVGRTRHIPWEELAGVDVPLVVIQNRGGNVLAHNLVVYLTSGKELKLPLGDRSFAFRDAIVSAAREAGVVLEPDED